VSTGAAAGGVAGFFEQEQDAKHIINAMTAITVIRIFLFFINVFFFL